MTSLFKRFSEYIADTENLPKVYAIALVLIAISGILCVPLIDYNQNQLYPKIIDESSSLNPYDRGGVPFENPAEIISQYPENEPSLGYVTAYLTPFTQFLADNSMYLGTTIVAHPGGILDEILYYTRGFDTVVETSILLCAFAIAAFLFRRAREE